MSRGAFVINALSICSALALASGTVLAQAPIPLGGGVAGQAASYVPNIPLTPRASQNLGGNSGLVYAQGMEFVRFNAVNNTPIDRGPQLGLLGGVTQEFAIGRFEVSRAVWVNFFDALVSFNQANPGNGVAWAQFPSGGRPTNVPGLEMQPVGGISWRTAAILCNWLHNDRAITREAFTTGVYDVSTFGWDPNNGRRFTDQRAASPGARFRLPTSDEWVAAAHFDPQRTTPPGAVPPDTLSPQWWRYANASNTAPVYGLPGAIINGAAAEANGGTQNSGVLLGSYPTMQSPWGLLDTAGGMSEWTETYDEDPFGGDNARLIDGSSWHLTQNSDFMTRRMADAPSIPDWEYGVRLVYVVPSPGGVLPLGVFLLLAGCRVRRR